MIYGTKISSENSHYNLRVGFTFQSKIFKNNSNFGLVLMELLHKNPFVCYLEKFFYNISKWEISVQGLMISNHHALTVKDPTKSILISVL